MLTLHTAWAQAFAAQGLDFALVETFTAPVRNPVVAFFLDMTRDIRALDARRRWWRATCGTFWGGRPVLVR